MHPSPLHRTLALGALAAALLLTGCDAQKVARLEEGVATEADVMREFGAPVDIRREADGTRVFEYTRQPEGSTNYFITIAPDGRMAALRQVLHAANFGKVQPGMTVDEVRGLLGRPAIKEAYELKKEEVWDWRWLDGQTRRIFRVTFDFGGRVKATATLDDPRDVYQGGK
ncbi:MAG: outer membrane protein assembly factor BamE [Pseudomonadota bacterium]|jgi:hypothetical protein